MGGESSKKHLETLSAEGRKLIGQAIIDGLITPSASIGVVARLDYGQNGGDSRPTQPQVQESSPAARQSWSWRIERKTAPATL